MPTLRLAAFSLTNYSHIMLFSVFFLMTVRQFQARGAAALAWAALATIAVGAFVELAEGATRTGHCRLRDLVPDAAAAVLGTAVVLAFQRVVALISSRAMPRVSRTHSEV